MLTFHDEIKIGKGKEKKEQKRKGGERKRESEKRSGKQRRDQVADISKISGISVWRAAARR